MIQAYNVNKNDKVDEYMERSYWRRFARYVVLEMQLGR